jgi:hypothetical protein
MSKRLRIAESEFQNLYAAGYDKRSHRDKHYNCIAYAAGDLRRWWDHVSGYWPDGVAGGDEIEFLIKAFAAVGFEGCDSQFPEFGYEKIALFEDADGNWTHAARLRDDGCWESKIGPYEDIIHENLFALEGAAPAYGAATVFMRRSLCMKLSAWLYYNKIERNGEPT